MSEKQAPPVILVVDDDPLVRTLLRGALTRSGVGDVLEAEDGEEARALLEHTDVDLVITDVKMPRHTGLDLLRHVRANLDDTEVIMMTGYPSVPGAVEAVKTGAEEYLAKPFTDEELLASVESALQKLRVRRLSHGRTPPLVQGPPAEELGRALGRPPVQAVGIRDRALASGVLAMTPAGS